MSKLDDLVLIFNSESIPKEEKEKRIPQAVYQLCQNKKPYTSALFVINFLSKIHDDEIEKLIIEEIKKKSENEEGFHNGKRTWF